MSTPMLPSIPWVPIPITPLPDVFEDNSETTWRLFDAAVRSMDAQVQGVKQAGRAARTVREIA